MNPCIATILAELYGTTVAPAVGRDVEAVLTAFQQTGGCKSDAELSERDVLLIAYADQVRAPGRAPLTTLAEFADTHLTGVVSGVHFAAVLSVVVR